MPAPPWWLLILWTAFVLQAWLSALIVGNFLRLFDGKRHLRDDHPQPATVIVPFKGIDTDLAAAVRSLCEQDYPDYQLFLVVQSEADPACEVLRRELARYPHRKAEVLIAGDAGPHEGQKVHNQLFALARLYETSKDYDAWVFADSDAVAGPDWLTRLLAALGWGERTGVVTGYRWLMPDPGAGGSAGVWSHLASVMNSSVACMMGRDKWNHAWGGTMAIRPIIARRGDLRGKLAGALCDDYQFTRLCTGLGLRVYFVPRCLVATPVHYTLKQLVNFGHRQYLLTRVYAPGVFVAALLIMSLYVAGVFSAVASLAWWVIREPANRRWVWPAAALLLAFIGDQRRAGERRRVVRRAFGDQGLTKLRVTLRYDRFATPLWMTLHWLIIVRSAFGRRMRWRGILYRLDGPQKCERLD